MADYVLLDFCSIMPVHTHPGKRVVVISADRLSGIRGLYHMVFSNDNTQVEIYDSQLNLQARESLMQ